MEEFKNVVIGLATIIGAIAILILSILVYPIGIILLVIVVSFLCIPLLEEMGKDVKYIYKEFKKKYIKNNKKEY